MLTRRLSFFKHNWLLFVWCCMFKAPCHAFSRSIVFFTSYYLLIGFSVLSRKKLFSSVHYFVNLNLAISLLLGYIVFMFGIELGTGSKVYNPLSITQYESLYTLYTGWLCICSSTSAVSVSVCLLLDDV